MMFELSLEQRKQLVDYMARRPYAEVYQLIAMIMSLKPNKEKKEEDKKDN